MWLRYRAFSSRILGIYKIQLGYALLTRRSDGDVCDEEPQHHVHVRRVAVERSRRARVPSLQLRLQWRHVDIRRDPMDGQLSGDRERHAGESDESEQSKEELHHGSVST